MRDDCLINCINNITVTVNHIDHFICSGLYIKSTSTGQLKHQLCTAIQVSNVAITFVTLHKAQIDDRLGQRAIRNLSTCTTPTVFGNVPKCFQFHGEDNRVPKNH